jgi:hypothetical protein
MSVTLLDQPQSPVVPELELDGLWAEVERKFGPLSDR